MSGGVAGVVVAGGSLELLPPLHMKLSDLSRQQLLGCEPLIS